MGMSLMKKTLVTAVAKECVLLAAGNVVVSTPPKIVSEEKEHGSALLAFMGMKCRETM